MSSTKTKTTVKSILISQPKPEEGKKSPYYDLADERKIKVDFRHFIHVEGIDGQEFRQTRVELKDHTAVIITSKSAIDHYFRLAEEMRFDVPDSMKFFCTNETIAKYLQKYIVYRKRKISFGKAQFNDLLPLIIKNKSEKFLLPLSAQHNGSISVILKNNDINFSEAIMYKTVISDLSDLADVNYDMLVFFSPSGIESLYHNFPDFKQNKTSIAVWGKSTAEAVIKKGLTINVQAPMPKIPSMKKAIEIYIDGK
ncbi:uroporphyrinogen-III synthase [Flavobacteriales bacterium]|nr:uroporphyrinogen-III synthase [Flavobacteriales bacterium]|tara:strand:+ start:422 stop:1183 length:762 start_codon:yes stop_codon:yes gene_type:complete